MDRWMVKCPNSGYSTTGFNFSEDHCEIVQLITFYVWFKKNLELICYCHEIYFKALVSQMVFLGMKTNLNIFPRKTTLTYSNSVKVPSKGKNMLILSYLNYPDL